jgi:signal transduction histidine kinase
MKLIRNLTGVIRQLQRKHLDSSSLRFRLTLEITALSIFGFSIIAAWSGWEMQQLLITTHSQNVEYIATRFPRDLEVYSEMLPLSVGIQKTINNVSVPGLAIWVKTVDGQKLLAQSDQVSAELMSIADMPLQPQVYPVRDRYLILYRGPVAIKGKPLGKIYMALDVTKEQNQLISAIQGLAAVCILASLGTMLAMAVRIRRLLQPLQEMNEMAGRISAAELSQSQLQVSHAPSEVKELAETFNMLLARLADTWEQQRQFVGNVSHELRTPLTVVLGYLQSLLRRSNNLTDYQREALETAESEANRTVRLLQDLLDLARADSGYQRFQLEPVLLNNLVAEVIAMAIQSKNRNIQIEATETVMAMGDRNQLKQVLINLIDNAIKYSDADRPIILSLEQIDDRTRPLHQQQAVIRVRDQGVGIPLQDQNRIFERFYRVDEARARATGGHGLGLAIVKTLVEGMGGSITVRSKPGEGSEFTVLLPKH